jgi:hypothetical protein
MAYVVWGGNLKDDFCPKESNKPLMREKPIIFFGLNFVVEVEA